MNNQQPPKLAHRRENRRSTIKSGRTIPGRREQLEKASERAVAHEKKRKKQIFRIVVTVVIFIVIFVILISTVLLLAKREPNEEVTPTQALNNSSSVVYKPTIEIIDEDAISGGTITARMKNYIGQIEVDFRALGIVPIKAVIPTGSIREVDFYIENKTGFIKTIIDRDTAVSAEDTKRMLNYLESNGITDFDYIDVRVDGRAYWK